MSSGLFAAVIFEAELLDGTFTFLVAAAPLPSVLTPPAAAAPPLPEPVPSIY